jgi:ABC-2 type transport system permease protein
MQQRGDDEAAPAAARYFEALERRRAFVARTSLLFPPAAFQLGLDEVARTGLSSHLGYLASVAAFHEELKRFFLPVIFSVKTVEELAWSEAPVHRYRDERPARLAGPAGALAAALATVGLASVFLLRRHLGRSPR